MSTTKTLRGKTLEKRINGVNLKYRSLGVAVIYNLPLPVAVTSSGPIPISTPTDYIGCILGGRGLAFDAKETTSKTSFPLANIHDHQINFLSLFEKVGGMGGFLIWFKEIDDNEAYFVPASFIKNFMETNTRKSIPYKSFKKCWKVQITDYLNLLNE